MMYENFDKKGVPLHYFSAYGIACKHGYKGTEEQWLESLAGGNAEIRYNDNLKQLEYKNSKSDEWLYLMSLSEIQGDMADDIINGVDGAVSRAEAAADAAKDAKGAAEAAKSNLEIAVNSAGSAATRAQGYAGDAARAASEAVEKILDEALSEIRLKLRGIESEANKTVIDTEFSEKSNNPVANRILTNAFQSKVNSLTFVAHKNDKNNPHGVKASDVGAYTTEESDGKFEEKIRNLYGSEINAVSNVIDGETFIYRDNLSEEWDGSKGTKPPFEMAKVYTFMMHGVGWLMGPEYVQTAVADDGNVYRRAIKTYEESGSYASALWETSGGEDCVKKTDVFDESEFGWTDFEYEYDNPDENDLVRIEANRIQFLTTNNSTLTIHCAGHTLGFTYYMVSPGTVSITINGTEFMYTNNNENVTVPITYMESDIVIQGYVQDSSFTNMIERSFKGIGDVSKALDAIFDIQNSLIGGVEA